MLTTEMVTEKLRLVLDPELGINIVDLGLIYNIEVKDSKVKVLMTLTFPGCPLGGIINSEIKDKLGSMTEIKETKLEITFDPPWDLSKISPEARAELGMN